jgi:hypothetical protein
MRMHIGVTLAAFCLLSAAAAAQDPPKTFVEARGNVRPVPLPPSGAPPRMADGKGMTRTEQELGNAQVTCNPLGVPGMWTTNPYPHQIVMKPNLFVHLIESNNNWRVVRIPRQHKPKEDQEPLYMGDTASRWEGDTLVLDTVSLDERTWIQGNGWYHSDQVRVTERYRRPSMNYLEYQYTVEDPKVLTKPWTSAWRTYSLGSEDLTENFCTNNENVEQLLKLNELEGAKGK